MFSAAAAAESPWTDAGPVKVRLVAAGPANASDNAPLRAGIEMRLAPGWHTYWRYPGDAGVPPRLNWSGSANVGTVELRWPAPMRFVDGSGSKSIGYAGNVIFPILVRASDPARPVKLALKLDFAVCEKLCLPAEARLALEIPPGGGVGNVMLDAAEARVPKASRLGEGKRLGVLALRLERGKEPRALVDVAVPPGQDFDLFAEGPTEAWALPLPDKIDSKDGRARFAIPIAGAPPGAELIPPRLRLTLVSGSEAIELEAALD